MMNITATRAGAETLQSQWQSAFVLSMTFRGCSFWRRQCTVRRLIYSSAAVQPQPVDSHCKTVKRKVALWVGYVGTHYKGLQIQRTTADGHTIEQELETAIFRAGGILQSNFGAFEKIRWMRSSRTDKGVHSLSTVITMKLEINPETWGCDNDGIGFADKINQYLPETMKIFGIVPVNKSFDPRRGCRNRVYRYLLPAASVGITQSMCPEEVQQRLSRFRIILSSFVGHHPYHNYTVRSQYRRKSSTSKKDSLKHDVGQKNSQLPLSPIEDSGDEDESFNDMVTDDLESSLPVTSTSSSVTEAVVFASPRPRINWLHEINMADRISSAHFRSVFSFTCGELQNYQGLQYLELNVHGGSFMLHQIRKMVGTAVAVMRDVLASDVIPISLSCSARVVLPLAPSEGLFLAGNEFYPFRTDLRPKGSEEPKNLPKLQMSAEVLERKEHFWRNVLLPHMVTLLQENKAHWENWLELLERARISEVEMDSARNAWSAWCQLLEERKAAHKALVANGDEGIKDAALSNAIS